MDINTIKTKITEARELAKGRNFTQTFDLVFNLQQMDLKRPDHKVDIGVAMDCNLKPKKFKVCAIIDHSITGAEEVFDHVLYNDDVTALKGNMEEIRKITHKFDKFVVQATLMPLFAQVLGRYLGPMNKMPSPKLGMVISNKSDLKGTFDKIQKTAHLQTKKNLVLQISIGAESESDDIIAKNIIHAVDVLTHALPNQSHNLKEICLKLTMGKVVRL